MVIARVEMIDNRMFPLHMKSGVMDEDGVSFKATCEDQSWLWHLRYGHLNFKGLSLLQRKEMVRGLPPIEAPFTSCESCIFAKKHRENFPKQMSYKAWVPLDLCILIYVVLCKCHH